jgi:hypothetical protein
MKTESSFRTAHARQDFLPKLFVNAEFDKLLLTVFSRAFNDALIKRAAQSPNRWNYFLATLKKHGLLELRIPFDLSLEDISIEIVDKDGSRRQHTHKWESPVPFGFRTLPLPIDRERLLEPSHAETVSAILAYLFCWKLNSTGFDRQDVLLLTNLNAEILDFYLSSRQAAEVSSTSLRLFILEREIYSLIDKLEFLKSIFSQAV